MCTTYICIRCLNILIILMAKDLINLSNVADHAHSPMYLGKIIPGHYCWWLIIDTTSKSSWAPMNELNNLFCFDCGNNNINNFWNNISTELIIARDMLSQPRSQGCTRKAWNGCGDITRGWSGTP